MRFKNQAPSRRTRSCTLRLLFAGFMRRHMILRSKIAYFPYAPPSRLHFRDASGFHLRPFVYGLKLRSGRIYRRQNQVFPIHIFVRASRYKLLGFFETNCHLLGVSMVRKIGSPGTDGFVAR
jgi:hypothetical protein